MSSWLLIGIERSLTNQELRTPFDNRTRAPFEGIELGLENGTEANLARNPARTTDQLDKVQIKIFLNSRLVRLNIKIV